MINPALLKAVIFDLDNTIYRETDYLFPAYHAIGVHVSGKDNIDASAAGQFLENHFLKSGRKNLFDNFIQHFNIRNTGVEEMMNILRTNQPEEKIEIFPSVMKMLDALILQQKKIFVLTNGNPQQQRNKIACIEWGGIFNDITFIFADEIKRKPSPESIEYIIKKYELRHGDVLMIGDDISDEEAAKDAGIHFIHAGDNAVLTGIFN